ncbi:hypothetical protein Tco_1103270 [Tanacetum coccineum]
MNQKLFDVDSLSKSMNYIPVIVGNQTNGIAGKRDNIVAGQAEKKIEPEQEYILIPFCITDPLISQGTDIAKTQENGQSQTNTDTGKEREYKSRENAIKGQQKSTLGLPKSTI